MATKMAIRAIRLECIGTVRSFLCIAMALSAVFSVGAKTNYVSQATGNNSNNGLSWSTAKKTIQAAISAAASGDTILVRPGVYADEEGLQNKNHWWGQSRIFILNKSLCIKSTDGPAVTHIVGKRADTESGYSAEGSSGNGTDVARCIIVQNATTNLPSVIQGFTLRDGYTNDRSGHPSARGGALMDSYDGANSRYSAYLVDCVISNCQGAVGGQIAVGGTFVRCRIQDNKFRKGANGDKDSLYMGMGGTRFLNCLFWRNMTVDEFGNASNLSVYWNKGRLVNCTAAANRCRFWSHEPTYTYNCIGASGSLNRIAESDGTHAVNQVNDNATTRMMMDPSGGDFRLREGTAGATGGDAAYLADSPDYIPMPEVDRLGLSEDFRIDPYIDLYGKTIPKTGAIACGAVQETAVPAAGAIVGANEFVMFPGMKISNNVNTASWMWPSNYPVCVKIGVATSDGYALHRFEVTGHGTGQSNLRYPLIDENAAWFIPPPSVDSAITIGYLATTNVKWVDAANAADTAQDGTEEHPYAVIQDAVDALGPDSVNTSGVIFVKPGTYATGGENNTFSDGTVYARVRFGDRRIRMVSTDGPERTVIMGAADPGSADGCGANAYMTISMSTQSAVQGFTLTGGHSGSGATIGSGRGPLYSYGRDLHVIDCIVTNNVGRHYALGTARYERSLLTGNTGTEGVTYAATIVASVVGNNTVTGDGGYHYFADNWQDMPSLLMSVTAVCDGRGTAYSDTSVNSKRVNSIIDRGGALKSQYARGVSAGCLFHGVYDLAGTGYTVADPMLRSAATASKVDDFRVHAGSPALTASVSPANDVTGVWWYMCPSDFYGKPWRFDASGRPPAGALQETFSGGAYVGGGNGGITVEGGIVGYNDLADGESLTVGLARGGTRPVAGFVVNGETNLFAKGHAATLTLTKEAGVDLLAVPILTSDWYVDANDGDDGNTGYNPASAFQTLARALTNAYLVAGDTVKALPGSYAEGEMYQSSSAVLPARAYVPDNVTLESTDGAADTFILGRRATAEIVPADAAYAARAAGEGMGTNSMRCVFLAGTATVRGFTLTNGFTRGFTDAGAGNHSGDDYNGGCCAGNGTVERCVLTDGHAFRGGGAFHSKCVNCIFDGNVAMYGGGASSDASHYGCLSRNNLNKGLEAYSGFFWWTVVEGCTVLDWLSGGNGRSRVCKNTLFVGKLGNWDWGMPDATNFVNCAVATDAGGLSALTSYGGAVAAGVGCIATNSANLAVDGDGRPVIGSNVAIDKGDLSLFSRTLPTDLSGGQRLYNGAIDIGALEADWRGIYAADVGGRAMTVQSAPETVVESAAHTVCVHPGQSLSATWAGRPGRTTCFELPLRVTGAGTLAVTINGETRTYTAADGDCIWGFSSAQAVNDVSVAYVGDDGYGELLAGGRRIGAVISFR